MAYALISILIQALLVVHCIKTGRNQIWIWVIVLLPIAGPLAYIAVELIPDVLRSQSTKRAVKGVSRALDPEKQLRAAADRARVSGNVATKQAYADELMKQGRAREAVEVYRESLTGLYVHDPKLLLGLAQAQFAAEDAAGARTTLDLLIAENPDFQSADGHLLYARAVEGEGNVDKALEEYKVLAGYYPGAEAGVRYARLLRTGGSREEADNVLKTLLEHARVAPAHYQRTQREWLTAAERELGG